ncbi:MAG: GNAT family N-acetyltransferase [Ruminococcaceae bacterium]|nr:GNAT family N-acetyltransferase [Oscillospiraceae bacterium]
MPNTGEVYAIYVLAAYHGQGIGYRLMTAAMEQLSAYDRIALWVLRGNERAIRFYERVGFSFDGTVLPVMLGTPNEELRYLYHKHHNENGEYNHDPA